MPKKINKTNEKIEKCQNSKFTDEEIEYILAENAYLKKLQALIQRKNQAKKR